MKIAMLTYYFPPDQSVGSIRPENWARWLSEKDEVTVVAPNLSRQYLEGHNLPYFVLRPRSTMLYILEYFNGIRKKFRKKTQISSDVGCIKPKKQTTGVLTYRMPCLHDLWFFSSYAALRRIEPDVIVATHGPYINLVTAWIYAKRHSGTLLWVDFRDLWTDNHRTIGVLGFKTVEKFIEKKILHSARVVTSVSEFLCQQLRSVGARSPLLVYNAPISEMKSEYSVNKSQVDIAFCYVGTIYPAWQDPSPFFRLLNTYLSSHEPQYRKMRIHFASRNAGNFLSLADEIGVRELIDYRGAVSREESLALQQQADILLLLESNAPEARGVLTGKLFEYLRTDKPILLVGPGPDSELYQLLQKHDRLFTLDDLERFLRGEMKSLPKGKPVDYSEISRGQLLAIMDSLAAKAGSGAVNA